MNLSDMQYLLNEDLASAAVSLVRRTALAFFAYMENPDAEWHTGGKYYRIPIQTDRGYAGTFLSLANDTIPPEMEGAGTEFRVGKVDAASPFAIDSDTAYAAVKGDDVAFASGVAETLDNARDSIKLRFDMGVMGTVRGVLGTIGAGGIIAGDDIDLTPAATDYQSVGSWWLPVRLRIDVINPATGAVRAGASNLTVAAHVNRNRITVTGIGASAAVASDWIVQTGSFNKCMTGLRAIIDDGTNSSITFQNVSRTLFPKTAAYLDTNAGVVRAATEDLLMDHIARRSLLSPFPLDFASCHTSVANHYARLLKDDRRFMPKPNGTEYPAGFGHFEFFTGSQTIQFCAFDWHPARNIWFQSKKRIGRLDYMPLRVADETGSPWHRTGRTDPVWGYLKWMGNLYTDAPNAHSELGALNIDPAMGGGTSFLPSW